MLYTAIVYFVISDQSDRFSPVCLFTQVFSDELILDQYNIFILLSLEYRQTSLYIMKPGVNYLK